MNLFRSNQRVILYVDIKSIKIKQRFSREFLDIRLKNGKLRRVIGIENSQELEDYIKLIIERNNKLRLLTSPIR